MCQCTELTTLVSLLFRAFLNLFSFSLNILTMLCAIGFARPESWEGHDLVVEVKKGSKEFEEVANQFESSVGRRVTIVKIERIQNHQLWQAYQAHKQDTVRVTPAGAPAERMLYHGCPVENVDSINSNGFVTNLAGSHVGECVHTVCRQTQLHEHNYMHRHSCANSTQTHACSVRTSYLHALYWA